MAKFTGIDATISELRNAVTAFEAQAVEETRQAARVVVQELFEATPVWSGQTVRNYSFGVGSPPSGGTRAAIGSGPPGDTNSMPIGSEPRRPANEAAVMSELNAVLGFRKLTDLFISNTVSASKWNLLESGVAPAPGRSRAPAGVSVPAIQNARGRLKNWK